MANISGIVKSARNIMRQDTGTGSDELRILQLGWMLFLKIFSDKDKEQELMDDNYTSPIPASAFRRNPVSSARRWSVYRICFRHRRYTTISCHVQ
jgi:hypothetical protein